MHRLGDISGDISDNYFAIYITGWTSRHGAGASKNTSKTANTFHNLKTFRKTVWKHRNPRFCVGECSLRLAFQIRKFKPPKEHSHTDHLDTYGLFLINCPIDEKNQNGGEERSYRGAVHRPTDSSSDLSNWLEVGSVCECLRCVRGERRSKARRLMLNEQTWWQSTVCTLTQHWVGRKNVVLTRADTCFGISYKFLSFFKVPYSFASIAQYRLWSLQVNLL